jgi:hypothetical protein
MSGKLEGLTADFGNVILSKPMLRLELKKLINAHPQERAGDVVRHWYEVTIIPGWEPIWQALGRLAADGIDWDEVARQVRGE